MNGYKRGKYLEFVLDNGKSVKYDLSTGQSIGVRGNLVKTVAPHMRNMSISSIINSIDDKNYRNFLKYVYSRCSSTIRNFGTLLLESRRFLSYEQYFSSGIENIIGNVPKFNDCPKKLLSLCRERHFPLDSVIIDSYKDSPDFFNLLCSLNFISLTDKNIYEMLDLKFGACRLCLAGKENGLNKPVSKTLIVATKYINTAKKLFQEREINVELIKLNGSVELGPIVGLSDIILDIVESGKTLKENNLHILEEICPVSARLVVNKVSLKTKAEQIKPFVKLVAENIQ